jgi:hypothetical protein
MEILLIILTLVVLGSTAITVRERSKITKAIQGSPESLQKILEDPRPSHRLLRTWIFSTSVGDIPAGWRWKCYCGAWGVAVDAFLDESTRTARYSLGSEKGALKGFKEHSAVYTATDNPYKEKYEKLLAEFDEYRRNCYCKNVNESLDLWKEPT